MISRVSAGRILRDVRILLDQNARTTSLMEIEDEDTLLLDDTIAAMIIEGVKTIECQASSWALDSAVVDRTSASSVSWLPGFPESGKCGVPEDLLRLVSFRMSDWDKGVDQPLSRTSPEYMTARSKYASLRGTPERPRVYLLRTSTGRELEFHSCRSQGAKVSEYLYLPHPTIDKEGGVDIATDCYEAVKYQIASLVLQSRGDREGASILSSHARELTP